MVFEETLSEGREEESAVFLNFQQKKWMKKNLKM